MKQLTEKDTTLGFHVTGIIKRSSVSASNLFAFLTDLTLEYPRHGYSDFITHAV